MCEDATAAPPSLRATPVARAARRRARLWRTAARRAQQQGAEVLHLLDSPAVGYAPGCWAVLPDPADAFKEGLAAGWRLAGGEDACEKREAKAEPDTICCSAEIRACGKRKAKLEPVIPPSHSSENSAREKLEAMLEPDMTCYSTAIRACEAQEAMGVCQAKLEPTIISHSSVNSMCEMWEVKAEPNRISYSAAIRTSAKGKAKLEPVIPITGHSTGTSACERWKAKEEPDTISYSAEIRACEKGRAQQKPREKCDEGEAKVEPTIVASPITWNSACEKWEATLEPDTSLSHNSEACEKGKAKLEPAILSSHNSENSVCDKLETKTDPNMISYSAAIRSCEKRKAKVEPVIPSLLSSLQPYVDSCSVAIGTGETRTPKLGPFLPSHYSSSCSRGPALAGSEPDTISISAAVNTCEKAAIQRWEASEERARLLRDADALRGVGPQTATRPLRTTISAAGDRSARPSGDCSISDLLGQLGEATRSAAAAAGPSPSVASTAGKPPDCQQQ